MVARMRKAQWWLLLTGSLMMLLLSGCNSQTGMLNPKGIIAYEQRRLFFDTLALMLIVVLPVIVMSFAFIYHYRASHPLKEYRPNWSHSVFLESLWWGIPCVIIVVLAILTWIKTYELDPYNKIPSANHPPMEIQVIALPWKWLFIYPQQGIATLNYLVVPVDQQVAYSLTADNVAMSAFFIPQLGSQIYVMAGMRTRLHLLANHPGEFDGMSTLYNGKGFSDMRFAVHVVEPQQMQQWVSQIKQSSQPLTDAIYLQLLEPTVADKPQFFSSVIPNLFKNVIDLYMKTLGPVHPRSAQGHFNN